MCPERLRSHPATKLDIDRLVDDVRAARRETDSQRAVEAVLERTIAAPATVLAALGEPTAAGIYPLYSGDDVTILNMVWAPLMMLLPHNHNMWASIAIYTGREDNILWQRQAETIETVGAEALGEGQVFGLPADAIHSVTNPIGRLTAAIHVYGGNFFAPGRSEWDAETLAERPFDLTRARTTFSKADERFKAVP